MMYEVRVQVQTDDERFFNLTQFKYALAHYATGANGVMTVWVNDQLYMPTLDRLEGEGE